MRKIISLTVLLLALSPIAGIYGQGAGAADLDAANDAWNDGKYTVALRSYLRLLQSAAGDSLVETIAAKTGELFQTEEITTDGRAPRLSPDGNLITYETGASPNIVTRLISTAGQRSVVA